MSNPTPKPASAPSVGSNGPLMPTRSISFVNNIDGPDTEGSDVTDTVSRDMPFDGVVSQMFFDIPNGVRSEAGFNVVDDERGITYYPWDEDTEYASFNAVTEFWPISFPLNGGDTIKVNYINTDASTDSHFLKVWAIVVGVEALPHTMDELAELEGVKL